AATAGETFEKQAQSKAAPTERNDLSIFIYLTLCRSRSFSRHLISTTFLSRRVRCASSVFGAPAEIEVGARPSGRFAVRSFPHLGNSRDLQGLSSAETA